MKKLRSGVIYEETFCCKVNADAIYGVDCAKRRVAILSP
jgi:hypothetical protein